MPWYPDGGTSWLHPPAPIVTTAGGVTQTSGGAQAAVAADPSSSPAPTAVKIAASLARGRVLQPTASRRVTFE